MSQNLITQREFIISQPSFPESGEHDDFYLEIANALADKVSELGEAYAMPVQLCKRISLCLTDYLEDIVSDAGIWRSFITANRSLYGYSVPFHNESEDYIDFELNREDVRFLVWYVTAMLWEEKRLVSPHSDMIISIADACFGILESFYDDAPVQQSFIMARGLEFRDPDDHSRIAQLGNWLFLHSYLMTPAYSVSLRQLADDIPADDPDYASKLNGRLEEAMMQDTTGPLALFTPEWVYLIIEGRLPKDKEEPGKEVHKYYKAFTEATGGKEFKIIGSYEELNSFFISALGWAADEEHLPQLKGAHDYVLMVNRTKGMLVAVDVARCFNFAENTLYDSDYARENSMSLLTDRGRCPGDLLQLAIKSGWITDARFFGSDDTALVNKYQDFIARCYLQLYYRGD